MKPMSTLAKIETLAADLAAKAAQDTTSIENKIEAVKVLASYYAALKKVQGRSDDDPGTETMSDFKAQLHRVQETGNGGEAVSSRRRGRSASN